MGIAERDFEVTFWGCDPTEVRSFLGEVDAVQKVLDARLDTLRAQLVELREAERNAPGPAESPAESRAESRAESVELPPIDLMCRGASEALVAARADAAATLRDVSLRRTEIVGSGRQEAARLTEEIRRATEAEVEALLEEGYRRRQRLDDETAELTRERDELAASLQTTVEMVLGLARGLGAPPDDDASHHGLVHAGTPPATNGRARTETEEHHGY